MVELRPTSDVLRACLDSAEQSVHCSANCQAATEDRGPTVNGIPHAGESVSATAENSVRPVASPLELLVFDENSLPQARRHVLASSLFCARSGCVAVGTARRSCLSTGRAPNEMSLWKRGSGLGLVVTWRAHKKRGCRSFPLVQSPQIAS